LSSLTGSGFFMHFDSSSVDTETIARLESRLLYPKRGFQCLEFYLYNSRNENEQLNIYVRDYSADDQNGSLNIVTEIKGIILTFLSFGFRVSQSLYLMTGYFSNKLDPSCLIRKLT
jgi:hypothetical protein